MEEITILIPSFNRRKFLPLIIKNLKIQDYPHNLLSVIIDDDGEEKLITSDAELKLIKEHLAPMKLTYINNKPWRTIGKKRNDMVKSAYTKIVAFMDSDDIYFPSYISHSYEELKKVSKKGRGCVGSDQMTFINTKSDNYDIYALDCGGQKIQLHEATLVFTKKWFNASCKFCTKGTGEGKNLIRDNENNVGFTEIMRVMTCLCHDQNTIPKDRWLEDKRKLNINVTDELKNILNKIFEK